MLRNNKCIWYKDHHKEFNYDKETYAFGVCSICRRGARKDIPETRRKLYLPKARRKLRKKK